MMIRTGATIIVATLLLTACDRTPTTPIEESPDTTTEGDAYTPTSPPIFRGVGQEPGWIVRVYPDYIVYEADYGERTVRVRTPEAEAAEGTVRYVTPELTVEIVDVECADAMSGARYGATVSVIEGERTLQGCGGEELSGPDEG